MEHLTYGLRGGLGWHDDPGSVYTMSLMLTAGASHTGGQLLLQRELGQHDKPVEGFQAAEFGDAYVFRSTWVHKVSPVRSGQRRVLVLEFWQAPDAVAPTRLNPPVRYPLQSEVLSYQGQAPSEYSIVKGSLNPAANLAQGRFTWDGAQAMCRKLPDCLGFTYWARAGVPWKGELWVDFKAYVGFNREENRQSPRPNQVAPPQAAYFPEASPT